MNYRIIPFGHQLLKQVMMLQVESLFPNESLKQI